MATIDIWLFGNPEWEIDLDKTTLRDIKDLGEKEAHIEDLGGLIEEKNN